MTSPIPQSTGGVYRAICSQGVAPMGPAVTTAKLKLSTPRENLPAIIVRYRFQSAAPVPSQARGVLRGALKRCYSRLASAPRIFDRGRGTPRPVDLNSFGHLARWSYPLKPLQKSPSGFAKCFRRLSSVVVHGTQHDRRMRPDVGYE